MSTVYGHPLKFVCPHGEMLVNRHRNWFSFYFNGMTFYLDDRIKAGFCSWTF